MEKDFWTQARRDSFAEIVRELEPGSELPSFKQVSEEFFAVQEHLLQMLFELAETEHISSQEQKTKLQTQVVRNHKSMVTHFQTCLDTILADTTSDDERIARIVELVAKAEANRRAAHDLICNDDAEPQDNEDLRGYLAEGFVNNSSEKFRLGVLHSFNLTHSASLSVMINRLNS